MAGRRCGGVAQTFLEGLNALNRRSVNMSSFSVQFRDLPDFQAYFKTISYLESIKGCAQYKITFRDSSLSKWDVLNDPDFTFQFRIVLNTDKDPKVGEWKTCHSGIFDMDLSGPTFDIVAEGFDAGMKLYQRASGMFFKDKLVSQMVSDLVAASGLSSNVTATKDTFTVPQGKDKDAEFISKFCLPMAYNSKRNDYLFYVKDGKTVVFAPPVMDQNPKRTFNTLSDRDPDLLSFHVRKHRSLLYDKNSISHEVRGWDTKNKRLISKTAKDSTSGIIKLASRLDKDGVVSSIDNVNAPFDEKDPKADQVESVGKSDFFLHAREMFISIIRLSPGDPSLSPGDLVSLISNDRSGKSHFSTGKWLIYSTKNLFNGSEYYTDLVLCRRSYSGGAA